MMYAVLGIATFVVLALLIGKGGVFIQSQIAPAMEEVRRETFDESRSHVRGINQDLSRYRLEHAGADGPHKEMLETLALQKASTVDLSDLTEENRNWINQLQQNRP